MQQDESWDGEPAAAVETPDADPVADPEPTGDPSVDRAMLELAGALRADADGGAGVAAFEAAHRALQDRLADVEG